MQETLTEWLEGLSETEKVSINHVLERNVELRNQDEERIRWLSQTLNPRKASFDPQKSPLKLSLLKACPLCEENFALLFSDSIACDVCKLEICNQCYYMFYCKHRILCRKCYRKILLEAKCGSWFSQRVLSSKYGGLKASSELNLYKRSHNTDDDFLPSEYQHDQFQGANSLRANDTHRSSQKPKGISSFRRSSIMSLFKPDEKIKNTYIIPMTLNGIVDKVNFEMRPMRNPDKNVQFIEGKENDLNGRVSPDVNDEEDLKTSAYNIDVSDGFLTEDVHVNGDSFLNGSPIECIQCEVEESLLANKFPEEHNSSDEDPQFSPQTSDTHLDNEEVVDEEIIRVVKRKSDFCERLNEDEDKANYFRLLTKRLSITEEPEIEYQSPVKIHVEDIYEEDEKIEPVVKQDEQKKKRSFRNDAVAMVSQENTPLNDNLQVDDLRYSADFASMEGESSDTMGEVSDDQFEFDEDDKPEFITDETADRSDDFNFHVTDPPRLKPNYSIASYELTSIAEEDETVDHSHSTSPDSLDFPLISGDDSFSSHSVRRPLDEKDGASKPLWMTFHHEKGSSSSISGSIDDTNVASQEMGEIIPKSTHLPLSDMSDEKKDSSRLSEENSPRIDGGLSSKAPNLSNIVSKFESPTVELKTFSKHDSPISPRSPRTPSRPVASDASNLTKLVSRFESPTSDIKPWSRTDSPISPRTPTISSESPKLSNIRSRFEFPAAEDSPTSPRSPAASSRNIPSDRSNLSSLVSRFEHDSPTSPRSPKPGHETDYRAVLRPTKSLREESSASRPKPAMDGTNMSFREKLLRFNELADSSKADDKKAIPREEKSKLFSRKDPSKLSFDEEMSSARSKTPPVAPPRKHSLKTRKVFENNDDFIESTNVKREFASRDENKIDSLDQKRDVGKEKIDDDPKVVLTSFRVEDKPKLESKQIGSDSSNLVDFEPASDKELKRPTPFNDAIALENREFDKNKNDILRNANVSNSVAMNDAIKTRPIVKDTGIDINVPSLKTEIDESQQALSSSEVERKLNADRTFNKPSFEQRPQRYPLLHPKDTNVINDASGRDSPKRKPANQNESEIKPGIPGSPITIQPGRASRFKAYLARLNSIESPDPQSTPERSDTPQNDEVNNVAASNAEKEDDFMEVFAEVTEEDLNKLSNALEMDVDTTRAIVDSARPAKPDPEKEFYKRLDQTDGLSETELKQVAAMMGMDEETARMVAKYVAMQNNQMLEDGNAGKESEGAQAQQERKGSIDPLSKDFSTVDVPSVNEHGFMYIRPLVQPAVSDENSDKVVVPDIPLPKFPLDGFEGLSDISSTSANSSWRVSPSSSTGSDYRRLMQQFERLGHSSVDDNFSERDALSVISEDWKDPSYEGQNIRHFHRDVTRTPQQSDSENDGAMSAPEDQEEHRSIAKVRRSNSDRMTRASQINRIKRLIKYKRHKATENDRALERVGEHSITD